MSEVSSRGSNGRNPSSGQSCSIPVTACNTHRPSTVVVSTPLSPQPDEPKAGHMRVSVPHLGRGPAGTNGPAGQGISEQAADLLVGADRGVEHMAGRLAVLAHRVDESLQSR